jgi:DNA polymerase III delta subunit
MPSKHQSRPPFIVVFGDDDFQKSAALRTALDRLLPPDIDRGMVLCEYDASRPSDDGGPTLAVVLDDLGTLSFFADRRVVVVRDADKFISAHRESLEHYAAAPHAGGTLILECRSFPKTTRLYKAVSAAGGELHECKKPSGRELSELVLSTARGLGKRLNPAAAARLIDLIGPSSGALTQEVEKLALYVGDRPTIGEKDVSELVGQSREEKIFAVLDAAGTGQPARALELWRGVLETDPVAVFRCVGGIAFVLRRWLAAQQMRSAGMPVGAIAPRVMMWNRQQELETILRRLPALRIRRALAALADLDAQAKLGTRSIETGVEQLIADVAM